MTTTKRLLLLVVLMNLILGTIGTLYTSTTYNENLITNQITRGEELRTDTVNDEGNSKPIEGTQLEESTRGNTLSMSSLFFSILWNGLGPYPFTRTQFNNDIEKLIVDILGLFRILMYFIIFYELYAVLKNKKTD